MHSVEFSKQSKRVVRIKRLFYMLIIIALLFGFSSCGTKGSNNYKEVDFTQSTPVSIEYEGVEYACVLSYNGNMLKLISSKTESDLSVDFIIDSLTCTIAYGDLKKVYVTDKLPADLLPVVLFKFFNSNGAILQFNKNKKTGEAVFDSIVAEPYVYIDDQENIFFTIN